MGVPDDGQRQGGATVGEWMRLADAIDRRCSVSLLQLRRTNNDVSVFASTRIIMSRQYKFQDETLEFARVKLARVILRMECINHVPLSFPRQDPHSLASDEAPGVFCSSATIMQEALMHHSGHHSGRNVCCFRPDRRSFVLGRPKPMSYAATAK